MGSGSPDESVSVLCMQNAALSINEGTPAQASVRNTLAFPDASAHMRRLFGPRGEKTRQDVLVAADTFTESEEEDFEVWAAYRKSKRAKKNGKGSGDTEKQEERKSSAENRTLNASNRKTGERNRCYAGNSGSHYAHQRPQTEEKPKIHTLTLRRLCTKIVQRSHMERK